MTHRFSVVVLLVLSLATVSSAQRRSDRARPLRDRAVRDPLVPSITVNGEGKVSAAPDMAEVQVGVVSEAASAATALEENNQAMNKLMSTLREQGIAEKDIQTSHFSISPRHSRPPPGDTRPPQIVGYTVQNNVRVEVRDLKRLGAILDQVVQSGANQVRGIQFAMNDKTKVLDEARRQAMADARRRASVLTEEAGVKLGRVLLINESAAYPRPIPIVMGAVMRGAEAAVPVAPGELDFTVNVTVTYALQ